MPLLGVAAVWGRPDQEPEGPARAAAVRCGEAPGSGMLRSTNVKLDEVTFDRTAPGDRVPVRVSRPWEVLELAWPVGAPVLPWLPRLRWPGATPGLVAIARIVHVDVETQGRYAHGQRVELAQPFDLVRLRYPVPDRAEPVESVDKIDHGSLAGLVEGASVRVAYTRDDPRDARILGASRRYRWLNPIVDIGTEIGLAALLLLVIVSLRRLFGWWRRSSSR